MFPLYKQFSHNRAICTICPSSYAFNSRTDQLPIIKKVHNLIKLATQYSLQSKEQRRNVDMFTCVANILRLERETNMSDVVIFLMRCCVYEYRFLNFVQSGPGDNKSISIQGMGLLPDT